LIAIPLLLYGCEIWTVKQRDIRRDETDESHNRIQFIRPQKKRYFRT